MTGLILALAATSTGLFSFVAAGLHHRYIMRWQRRHRPTAPYPRVTVIAPHRGRVVPEHVEALIAQEEDPESQPDYITEIETLYRVVDDPDIVSRIQTIRDRLIAVIPEAATDDREIIVKVLDDENVNAFAVPDGHLYFFKGLLDACETDDMLAGVMAHELVHVFHRHHSRMGDRQIAGRLRR